MFESENRYFNAHRNELYRAYADKFIVLQGDNIKGSYDTIEQAYTQSAQTMQPGTFAIKHVTQHKTEPYYLTRVFPNG